MKREDLKKLLGENALDTVIDEIMRINGADIEAHKTKVTELQGQVDTSTQQLTEANKQIEGFKGMNIEEIKKSADEYKAKFEQAQKDSAEQIAAMQFDHEFDGALTGAKAKWKNEVKSRLKLEELKDASGKFIAERFNEQIGKLKAEAVDLFESDKPTPKIVTGGNNKSIQTDAVVDAMRKGAGLPAAPEQG